MYKPLFALILAGFLARPALAQVIIQPTNIFQNPLALVDHPDVQKDLKLAGEQIKKITDLKTKYLAGLQGIKFQELDRRRKVNEAAQRGLAEVLSPDQAKRLKQLELQQRGANAFLDSQIVKELALTADQQAAARKIMQGFGSKWLAIIQAAKGNQQDIQKKVTQLTGDLQADVVKGLTAEQQAKWRDLAGPRFAGVFPAAAPVGIMPDPRPQPVLTWIMNDLAAAQREAKKTGKPIFVTFRCEA